MNTCLSEFGLDNLVLDGEGSGEALAHLQTCEACRRRREERDACADVFESTQADAFWTHVGRSVQRRRRQRWTLALALPSVLAVASVMVMLVVRSPDSPWGATLVAKGSSFVEIHCRRAGKTFAVRPENSVQAGDELRFVPRPSSAKFRYVQVASIDGTGRYAPFYPSDLRASSLPLPAPGEALDGSIRLDSAPGPERLFFVFSSVPLPVPVVQQTAQAQVADLRPASQIGGAAIESGWVVLPKTVVPAGPR